MNLAFVTSYLTIKGGRERFILEVVKRLVNRGITTKIFCQAFNPNTTFSEFKNLPVESLNSRTHLIGKFAAYFGLKNMKELVLKAERWGADIIFLQSGYIFGDYLQKYAKKPIISYSHDVLESFGAKNSSMVRDLYRRILGISESKVVKLEHVPIICNSDYTAKLLKEQYPEANVICVVHPGVNLEKFKPKWADQGYLFYHSRFEPRKNQKLLIEIAANFNYSLILAGYLDEKNEHYYNYLVKNATSNVTILKNLADEEILSYLQNCSVFLFPAIGEFFGLTVLEAMACGKPVIVLDSGAPPELIGGAGYVCKDDLKDWIAKTEALMANKTLRKRLGKKACEVAQKYSWENTVSNLEKIFYSYAH